ncbi:protein disulfide-isomerase A1 [Microdochium nivale]|nr:protein disulfide-isomerase A1 [Microdochium nivale]
MVRSLLCLSTAILLGGATRAWEHLNHKSFHEAVSSHEHAVVAFLRSDDPGNAALEAEWIEAKGETSIPFLSVDCLAEPEHRVLCSSGLYDNSNLPVISMLQHGELRTTYPGPRRAAAILQWTNRAKRNPVVQELTASSLSAFKTAEEAACVAFLPREDIVVDDHDSGSNHPAHSSLRQHWEHIAESTPIGGRVSMGLLVNPPAQTLTDQGLGKHLPAVKCWTNKEMKVGDKGAAAAAAAAATAAIANNPYVKTNKWLSRDKSSASKPLSGKAALAAGVPELRKFIADATRSVIGELTAENHEEYLQVSHLHQPANFFLFFSHPLNIVAL